MWGFPSALSKCSIPYFKSSSSCMEWNLKSFHCRSSILSLSHCHTSYIARHEQANKTLTSRPLYLLLPLLEMSFPRNGLSLYSSLCSNVTSAEILIPVFIKNGISYIFITFYQLILFYSYLFFIILLTVWYNIIYLLMCLYFGFALYPISFFSLQIIMLRLFTKQLLE